jgi:opacity protein-like surface antigen
MKKLLIIAAVLGLSSAAMAADLPSKVAPLPPVRSEATLPYFVGINAGNVYDSEVYTLGVNAGVNLNEYVAAEVAYDHIHNTDANLVTGNLIAQTRVGSFKPYVLGGVGHRWADNNEAIWNVGVGTKVALTEKIDVDVRYRYVAGFDTKSSDNIITGGLVFKF